MRSAFFAPILLCLLLVAGCASSPTSLFKNIPMGASKGQVLGELGNPVRTYRKANSDRWVYEIPSTGGTPVQKEIWFSEGKVVYKDGEFLRKDQGKPKDSDFEPIE